MINLEREQLFLEGLVDKQPSESLEREPDAKPSSELEEDTRDCKVCGDSGPCSVCERGRKLKIEQDKKPYRRKR